MHEEDVVQSGLLFELSSIPVMKSSDATLGVIGGKVDATDSGLVLGLR
jgi:hypothetical protein